MNLVKIGESRFFWSTQRCKLERLWQYIEQRTMGFRSLIHADHAGLKEIRWLPTYCKRIHTSRRCDRLHLSPPSKPPSRILWSTRSYAIRLPLTQICWWIQCCQPNKSYRDWVGFNKGHPVTHRCTKGGKNKTMATYWCSGLAFIRHSFYIKLQHLLLSRLLLRHGFPFPLRPLLLIRPYQPSRSPTTQSPFEAFPVLPRHIFRQGIFHLSLCYLCRFFLLTYTSVHLWLAISTASHNCENIKRQLCPHAAPAKALDPFGTPVLAAKEAGT